MSNQALWIFLTVYALVFLFALHMTRIEQVRSDRSWKSLAAGTVACVIWPATLIAIMIGVVMTGAYKQEN